MFYDRSLGGEAKVSDAVSLLDRVMNRVSEMGTVPVSELLWGADEADLHLTLQSLEARQPCSHVCLKSSCQRVREHGLRELLSSWALVLFLCLLSLGGLSGFISETRVVLTCSGLRHGP